MDNEHAYHVNVEWNFLSDSDDPDVIGVRVGSFLSDVTKHWRDDHVELELASMSSIRIIFEKLEDVRDRLDRDGLLLDDIRARVTEVHGEANSFVEELPDEFRERFGYICSSYTALLALQMELMNARDDANDLYTPFAEDEGGENN